MSGSVQSEMIARHADAMMNTFGSPKRVFVRGEGARLWDADGVEHVDLLSGLAVVGLGHAHPEVRAAIDAQLGTLGHVSNLFATPGQIELAERLAGMARANDPTRPARVFLTNSGAEANEAAFKLARLTNRPKVVAMEGSFHGRTMGALAITHNPPYREPFEPLPAGVEFVAYGDVEALEAACDERTAAIVLEPVQGEAGVRDPGEDYLRQARRIADATGALLWLDEVQTGMGRCGQWLAHTPSGVSADIVTLAKGLGNGFPIGACVATGEAASLFTPGSHGTTFGGNPVGAAAGLAVIGVIERDGLLARSTEMGERLASSVAALEHPLIERVRGRGLLRGVVLRASVAREVVDAALADGFVVNSPRPDVIRLAPPLVTPADDLDRFVAALPGWLAAV